MASGSSTNPEDPPHTDYRIVVLGKAGAGKNKVVKVILGDSGEVNEESEECFLYDSKNTGRWISVVDTPGWDKDSIECTTRKIKNEISRSVMLCPPGPHALILVLPVNPGDVPCVNEVQSASRHMELLSERVWDHTVLLFLCDKDVEESAISEHIHNARKLLEKCKGRHYVMRQSEYEKHIHGLLKEIDSMVEQNLGDFFLPQVYYDVIQSKIPQDIKQLENFYKEREELLKQGYQRRLIMHKNQVEEEIGVKQRRGSFDIIRPSFSEDENQPVNVDAIKSKYRDELQELAKFYLKPISLLMLAVIGALIGSVVGSNYGVVGSGVGIIVGIVVTIPLALQLIKAASLARQISAPVKEVKSEHKD